jgi:hypothetical protein
MRPIAEALPRLDALAARPAVARLARAFGDAGHELALVGGPVRDALLGRPATDLDFTTDAPPDEIERLLKGWADAIWTQGKRFGTIGCSKDGRRFEITTHRAEAYAPDSRKPDVTFAHAVEADLARRDELDSTRDTSPLLVADDAVVLDAPYLQPLVDAPLVPAGGAPGAVADLLDLPLASELVRGTVTSRPVRRLGWAELPGAALAASTLAGSSGFNAEPPGAAASVLLAPGALVALHDYANPGYPGVAEAVAELGLGGRVEGGCWVAEL